MQFDSFPATNPPAMLVCSPQPDIIACNAELKFVSLLELTCPSNSLTDLYGTHKYKHMKSEHLTNCD